MGISPGIGKPLHIVEHDDWIRLLNATNSVILFFTDVQLASNLDDPQRYQRLHELEKAVGGIVGNKYDDDREVR